MVNIKMMMSVLFRRMFIACCWCEFARPVKGVALLGSLMTSFTFTGRAHFLVAAKAFAVISAFQARLVDVIKQWCIGNFLKVLG